MQTVKRTRSVFVLSAFASAALFADSQAGAATIVFTPTATTATGEASFDVATNYTPNSTPTNSAGSSGEFSVFTGAPAVAGDPIINVRHSNTAINPRFIQINNSGGPAAAFTFVGSQLNLYNSIDVQTGVTTNQTFSTLISLRTGVTTFTNSGSGTLSLSSINQNSSNTNGNPVSAVFTGVAGGNIQLGALNNSGGAAGTGTTTGLTKNGANQLLLNSTTAISTYSGPTTVNAGVLAVAAGVSINNTAAGFGNAAAVTVNAGTSGGTPVAGGTLAGSGTIAHPVILANTGGTATTFADGATLSPGVAGVNNGIGTLTLSSTTALTTGAFSNINFDLTATPATTSGTNDLLTLGAVPSFTGATQLNVSALANLGVGTYALINGYTGTVAASDFARLALVVAGDTSSDTFALANNAGEIDLVVSVPEPATASLALIGIGATLLRRRRLAGN